MTRPWKALWTLVEAPRERERERERESKVEAAGRWGWGVRGIRKGGIHPPPLRGGVGGWEGVSFFLLLLSVFWGKWGRDWLRGEEGERAGDCGVRRKANLFMRCWTMMVGQYVFVWMYWDKNWLVGDSFARQEKRSRRKGLPHSRSLFFFPGYDSVMHRSHTPHFATHELLFHDKHRPFDRKNWT